MGGALVLPLGSATTLRASSHCSDRTCSHDKSKASDFSGDSSCLAPEALQFPIAVLDLALRRPGR